MRRMLVVLLMVFVSTTLFAQRPRRPAPAPTGAEADVKEAMERLGHDKKAIERELQALAFIRNADRALADAMQPSIALDKAFEQISEAERLNVDFYVQQGVIRVRQELEDARRSPASADFDRLRGLVRSNALRPASRLVVRSATRLQEETLAWLEVQESIAMHLKMLSEITGECLRAADQEN